MIKINASIEEQNVIIKIDTSMLEEMFEDIQGGYYQIKDSKQFAIDIANEIVSHLESSGLEDVIQMFPDGDSKSIEEE